MCSYKKIWLSLAKTADILAELQMSALFDCVVGANRSAAAAADACVGIDLIDVTC